MKTRARLCWSVQKVRSLWCRTTTFRTKRHYRRIYNVCPCPSVILCASRANMSWCACDEQQQHRDRTHKWLLFYVLRVWLLFYVHAVQCSIHTHITHTHIYIEINTSAWIHIIGKLLCSVSATNIHEQMNMLMLRYIVHNGRWCIHMHSTLCVQKDRPITSWRKAGKKHRRTQTRSMLNTSQARLTNDVMLNLPTVSLFSSFVLFSDHKIMLVSSGWPSVILITYEMLHRNRTARMAWRDRIVHLTLRWVEQMTNKWGSSINSPYNNIHNG